MENFIYAIDKSYAYMVAEIEDVLKDTKYSDDEKKRLFFACGTCLHWILDYADRVTVSKEDEKYISAFRHANNSLKHEEDLFEITEQTGGFSFPFEFPTSIEKKEIRWKDISCNPKYINQYHHYNDILKGEEVISSCKRAIDILLKCK